jgi:hypothetical protein
MLAVEHVTLTASSWLPRKCRKGKERKKKEGKEKKGGKNKTQTIN